MKIFEQETLTMLRKRVVRDGSPALSVYLNIDPSVPVNAKGGYKTVMDQMLAKIEKDIAGDAKLMSHYQEDSRWMKNKVEQLIPKGKTFIAFCDVSEDFFYEEEVPLRFANIVLYEDVPYVRPILEAIDEHERYAIVVMDSEKARFFTLTLGQIEEIHDTVNIAPVKYRKGPGSDHMRSQTVFQRRAETWTNWFMKDTGDTLQDIMDVKKTQSVILMGISEVTSEFFRLLPKGIQEKVVARIRIPFKARTEEIMEVVLPIIEERNRISELRIVTDLITTASKTSILADKAVLGINPVLNVINQGRAYLLVYPSDYKSEGFYCPKCEVLMDHAPLEVRCPYCGSTVEKVENILWMASEKILAFGGKIEEIKSEDAKKKLKDNGIVGAFLR